MEEEWRDIPAHEGRYQVSSLGQVKRIGPRRPRTSEQSRPQAPGQERVWPGSVVNGYYKVCLKRGAVAQYVHRLVCEAFHGPPPEGKTQVAHGDGDKLNNRADNLRWADWIDNRADGRRLGEVPEGERHCRAILTAEDVKRIRERHSAGEGLRAIGRGYGICHQHVGDIIRRKIWKSI